MTEEQGQLRLQNKTLLQEGMVEGRDGGTGGRGGNWVSLSVLTLQSLENSSYL